MKLLVDLFHERMCRPAPEPFRQPHEWEHPREQVPRHWPGGKGRAARMSSAWHNGTSGSRTCKPLTLQPNAQPIVVVLRFAMSQTFRRGLRSASILLEDPSGMLGAVLSARPQFAQVPSPLSFENSFPHWKHLRILIPGGIIASCIQ